MTSPLVFSSRWSTSVAVVTGLSADLGQRPELNSEATDRGFELRLFMFISRAYESEAFSMVHIAPVIGFRQGYRSQPGHGPSPA